MSPWIEVQLVPRLVVRKISPTSGGTRVSSWVTWAVLTPTNSSPSGRPVGPGGKAIEEVLNTRSLSSTVPLPLTSTPIGLVVIQVQATFSPWQSLVTAKRPVESATPNTPSSVGDEPKPRTPSW